jgi:PAS domain S-box-containing protein
MDGTILYANDRFQSLIQLTLAELKKFRFQQLLAPGAAIFYETQFAPSLILRGYLDEISFDLVRTDKSRIPIFVNAITRRNTFGASVDIVMALFEARQRRAYEEELLRSRRSSEQVAEVVSRSSDAIIALTDTGAIQNWNRGAAQIFGWQRNEALGQDLAGLLLRDNGQIEFAKGVTALRSGVDHTLELEGFHKSGRAIDLSISLTAHMEAPGVLVAFSAIIRDITARKLAEKALIQTEKLASVGRLASSIAHEINNPLEAVTNLLYILAGEVKSAKAKDLVQTAQDELARVSHIATHTLRFHRQSSNRTPLDFSALFESVVGLYRARLSNSGIMTEIKTTGARSLYCYEGELRQIIVNIVANAYDSMKSGGRLLLRARNATDWRTGAKNVRLTVADTGTGIDREILSRMFEPFFTTKGIGGTGLGLWITQGLVEHNRGTIKLRSATGPRKSGTVVVLCFPVEASGDPTSLATGLKETANNPGV